MDLVFLPPAEVHVGEPGGRLWSPLERSVGSLPAARTGESRFSLTLESTCRCPGGQGACPVRGDSTSCVQVGIVSVALCAPAVEGSYTSHWRLAHAGEQLGPRVWCSVVVDALAPAPVMADGILVSPCVTPQVEPMRGPMETGMSRLEV